MKTNKPKLPEAYWYDIGQGVRVKVVDATISSNYNFPILDWEGVEDKDGNPIPYSKEKAMELLNSTDIMRPIISTLMRTPKINRVSDAIWNKGG